MSEQSGICLNQSGQADFIELKNHTGLGRPEALQALTDELRQEL
jgi:hypothetical protein